MDAPATQLRVLTAGAVDVISEADLTRKLTRGTPLRVKLGIDPTAPDIHLGFAVVLRKLRQFQELGHLAVLILGDFTAQLGDPSGRSATRPPLSAEEIDQHARTYVEQVEQILLPDRLEIRRNSEWLRDMGIADVLRLSARTTVARMLERDDFATRYRDGRPISLSEFLYPLLQGWDSVVVHADVELGGTDQLFNNLMGRTLQEQEGQEGQVVLTMPLLEGLDGVQKMSKSLGNYVGITEPPGEQFGKVMSVPDALMPRYFALTTGWDPDRVTDVTRRLSAGELAPVDAKRLLAHNRRAVPRAGRRGGRRGRVRPCVPRPRDTDRRPRVPPRRRGAAPGSGASRPGAPRHRARDLEPGRPTPHPGRRGAPERRAGGGPRAGAPRRGPRRRVAAGGPQEMGPHPPRLSAAALRRGRRRPSRPRPQKPRLAWALNGAYGDGSAQGAIPGRVDTSSSETGACDPGGVSG